MRWTAVLAVLVLAVLGFAVYKAVSGVGKARPAAGGQPAPRPGRQPGQRPAPAQSSARRHRVRRRVSPARSAAVLVHARRPGHGRRR